MFMNQLMYGSSNEALDKENEGNKHNSVSRNKVYISQ